MSKELIVSTTAHETKVAIQEDDELTEVYFERESQYGLAGSIYKGRVTRVLPGMQSAFVSIGLERDAFLYVSDFFEDNEEYDRVVTTVEDKVVKMEEKAAPAPEVPAEPPEVNGNVALPAQQGQPAPARSEFRADRTDRTDRTEDANRWGRRGGRGGRRRRPGGRGFPESKFAPRSSGPPPRPSGSPTRPIGSPPPARPMGFEPRSIGALPPGEDFEVLPGESLARHNAASDDPRTQAAGSTPPQTAPQEPEFLPEPVVEAIAERAGPLAGSTPPEAAPDEPEFLPEPVVEAIAEAEAAVIEESPFPPEPAAAEEVVAAQWDAEPPAPADGTEDGIPAVDVAPAGDASPYDAAPAAAHSAESEDERQPDFGPPGTESREASVRERPYGRRYLHRTGRRKGRRGRPEGGDARERRGPERGPQSGAQPRPGSGAVAGAVGGIVGGTVVGTVVNQEPAAPRTGETSITDLLKEGQEIIVQIAKEPIGKKGARITSHIALPGRYLVYMPTVDHVGVSRRIVSDEERARLKRVVGTHRTGMPGGFIVRTAGEGQSEDELRSDMHFLYNLWLDMRQKAERRAAPALIHHDLNLVERILRDQLTETFKTIWVDAQDDYERILHFVERHQPALVNRVKLYTRSNPIFDEFGITPEIEKALRPKVWLKSGGYIVINQTEALVAIDVNTGKYVGKSNRLEDTIVKTNMDAVLEIVRQIRLRDLGGIIVVDFIDMDERKNRHRVMQALDEALHKDRAPSKILQFNDFGLVAITRKRVKQSLERTLCESCSYCEGSGWVKSVETMIQEILAEAKKIAPGLQGGSVTLRVHPHVARALKSRDSNYLEEIEGVLRRSVLVKGDAQLHQEKFDFN